MATNESLLPAPASVEDASGAPRFGTWRGALEVVDLQRLRGGYALNALERLRSHKKWLYGFVATQEVAALFAVVDVGYSANAFVMALDYTSGRVLADGGLLGLPGMVRVNDHPASGLGVSFRHPLGRWRAHRAFGDERYVAEVTLGGPLRPPKLQLHAEWLTAGAAPPLTVIAPVDGGIVNVTQKAAGLLTRGHLEADGRRFSLEGGVGGLDYTHGYLARETSWRWAFVCGRLDDGTPLAINLVEGFNEARDDVNENAVWLGHRLLPVGRARFTWNPDAILEPWSVRTTDGALDLRFKPWAAHQELRDLTLVKSAFKQPVGLWEGEVKLDGRTYAFSNAPGVAEDQSVLW